MIGFTLRRLAVSLLLVLAVASLTFLLLHLAPGDPLASLVDNPQIPADYRAELRRVYGLDRPLDEQYFAWLGAVARGDWGMSISRRRPVARVLAEALPATAMLALAALAIEYLVALPLGLWAARRRGSPVDQLIRAGSLVLYSVPTFWLALMAVLLLVYLVPVFPPSHMHSPDADGMGAGGRLLDLLHHLALPALVLGLAAAGGTARFIRNSLLEVLGQDYVRTARAKGLSERRVVVVHALRNALAPLLQLLGVSLPVLLNGSLVIEVIFAWPGVGRATFEAILARDYPLVLAATMLSAFLVVAGNLAADLLHTAADPRLRDGVHDG